MARTVKHDERLEKEIQFWQPHADATTDTRGVATTIFFARPSLRKNRNPGALDSYRRRLLSLYGEIMSGRQVLALLKRG